ncbi:tetratricopeptide repeat protein [Geothrix fuzhouensis]|uniref:tetratricopeptide repeat protein n=1 Tax=Geothrix fuzhouensis TaxID=2966451 RepID=UPI0021472F6F|nr:tetratricopeptide repeat protein [Geothrix fuzhouensis]
MTPHFPCRNHWKFFGVVLLVGLLTWTLPLRSQTKDFTIFPRYKALAPTLDKVDRLVADRQFDQARALIRSCLATIPDHFEAHYYLALMAYDMKDYETALACIERSMASLGELDRLYQVEIAKLEASNRQTIELLEGALKYTDLGAGNNGCWEGDILSLKTAISMEKRKSGPLSRGADPFTIPREYPFLQGNCLFRLGRHAEAKVQYRDALKVDSTYSSAWNNLINVLWVDREYDQATASLHLAEAAKVQIDPKLRMAVMTAGKSAFEGAARAIPN